MKKIFTPFLLCFCFFLLAPVGASAVSDIESSIISSLEDLRDVPEIRWVKVDKKNIVIGWKGIPSNFPMINRNAAINANKAVGYLIHVWSVRHTQKEWTIGTKPYLCKTVAERRRIQESACRF